MDLAEALLHRYTTSVVAILNAVRPTLARPHPHAAPRSSLSAPRSQTTRRTRPPEPTSAPADMRLLDRSQQSSSESGDASRSLGALRDLLPALSALAPTGGPQLINTLTRWYQQQVRTLASSSGDRNPLGRSRTLQLAFWHAAHRVLAPLPPGALAPNDVARVIDLAFDAIVAGRDPDVARTPAGAPGPWRAALRIRRRTLRIMMRVGASTDRARESRWVPAAAATPRSTRRRRRWTLRRRRRRWRRGCSVSRRGTTRTR